MRMSCNAITITDDEGKDVGIGLFLGKPMEECRMLRDQIRTSTSHPSSVLASCANIGVVAANHSCDPNAHAVFEGPTLRLRALRAIREGEEICIGYVDVARPRSARQGDLKKGYGFSCSCRRCQVHTQRAVF